MECWGEPSHCGVSQIDSHSWQSTIGRWRSEQTRTPNSPCPQTRQVPTQMNPLEFIVSTFEGERRNDFAIFQNQPNIIRGGIPRPPPCLSAHEADATLHVHVVHGPVSIDRLLDL